jgi:hypothetical protein
MKMVNIPIRDLHHLDLSMYVSGWSPLFCGWDDAGADVMG